MYKPTDRERQRYVTYAGPSPLPTFKALFGVVGQAEAGLQEKAPGLLRTTARGVDAVKAAIALTPGARSISVRANITKAREPIGAKNAGARNVKP